MQTWYEVKVKYVKIDQSGRERKVSELILLDAVSFTDAETRITEHMKEVTSGEFKIEAIKKSNIGEIFAAEDTQFWFKAKITFIAIDEEAGKEKKVNNYILIAGDDLDEARERLEEGLSHVLVPYTAIAIALSPITDVIPYYK